MQIDLEGRPSYGMAIVTLDKGEAITAESGAMVAMSPGLGVNTSFNGASAGGFIGFLKAALVVLARKFLAGESMFVNEFRATEQGQTVMLAPAMVGDVERMQLDATTIKVQATSYLASTRDVHVGLIWGGLSMLFSGEGAFFLACSGKGELLINAYGGIEKVDVDGSYMADTGHVVAWEGDLSYNITKPGGWKSAFLSGEGLVMVFSGKGTLWLQTRNLRGFVSWISPFFPS